MSFRYLSLFSGVEAASLAWQDFGWKAAAVAEIEPFPCAVLAYRWPEIPNLGDVSAVDWQSLQGEVDVLIGGSPCQAFSVAGLRRGLNDARGNLIFEYLRAVRDVAPDWVVFENVPGLLSTNKGAALTEIIAYLTSLGYAVDANIYDAQDFGVPQRRRRVFLVGHRLDRGLRQKLPESAQTVIECLAEASYLALSRQIPGASSSVAERRAARERAKAEADYAAMLRDWRPNEAAWAKTGDLVIDALEQRLTLIETALAKLGGTPQDMAALLGLAIGVTPSPSFLVGYQQLLETLRSARNAEPSAIREALVRGWAGLLPTLVAQASVFSPAWPASSTLPALMEALTHDSTHVQQGSAADEAAGEIAGLRDRHDLFAAACAELRELARDSRDIRSRSEILPDAPGVRRDSSACNETGSYAPAAAPAGSRAGRGASAIVGCSERAGTLTSCGAGVNGADDNAARSGHLVRVTPPCADTPCPEHETAPCLRAGNPYNNSDASMEAQMVIPTVGNGQTLAFYPHSGLEQIIRDDVAPTLTVGGHGGSPPAVAFSCKDDGRDATEDLAPTLRAMGHAGSHPNAGGQLAVALSGESSEGGCGRCSPAHEPLAIAQNQRGELRTMPTCGALNLGGGKPGQGYPAVFESLSVRRLTVRECERLQGMPDDHTRIPYRGRSAEQCPDGPRYKAIGNSFAVPVVRWIGAVISEISRRGTEL